MWWPPPQNNVYGGHGLFLKPKDMAKVGQLMLNNGLWEGNEIIPESWVKASTDTIVKTGWPENGRYGYQWWIYRDLHAFCSRGYVGQDMYVIPDRQLIVVFNSRLPIDAAAKTLNKLVRDKILPAIAP